MNSTNKKLAFVFPGQGSQSVGMMNGLADAYPLVVHTFNEASEALGYDLFELVANGPEDMLNQTDRTQPAMLTAGVATWRVWQGKHGPHGPQPVFLAGHSLGEYTALVCSNAMSLGDAVNLVADRGRYMQEAVPAGEGAMAAIIGLNDDAVVQLCSDNANDEVLSAVNFNSPGQVVIAGSSNAVKRAVDTAKSAGAKRALILPVSVPSHCALMQPAAERLAERLAEIEITAPTIPVLHNTDVSSHTDPAAIREALVQQLYSPVRWVETIQSLTQQGVTHIVECGPGKVLTGLNKRINKDITALPVFDPESLDAANAELGE
jgi:[acyl-carrier-protein] S-malonyltransferase